MEAVAVTLSIACPEGTVQGGGGQDRAPGVLAAFRCLLYRCFSKRPGLWPDDGGREAVTDRDLNVNANRR